MGPDTGVGGKGRARGSSRTENTDFLCDLVERSGYFASGVAVVMTFPCGRCTVTSTHGCYACVWATSRCPGHCLSLRNDELFCPAASSTNAPRMTAKRIPSKTGRPGSGENEGAWRAGGSRRAPRVHRRGLPHSSVLISPPRHPPEVSGVSIPVLHMKKPQHRELNFPSQALTTAGPRPGRLAMVSVTWLPPH